MKSCPTCNRTYADESLTYCLADGSLLSAPYDPEATLRIPPSRITNAPTEVLPRSQPTKQNISPHLIYAVAGLVAMLIVVIGIVMLLKSGAQDISSSGTSTSQSPSVPNTSSTAPSKPSVTSNVNSKPDNPAPISVPLLGYASANWNQYGPGYDGTDVNHVTSLWMRASGYITYQVSLPETKRNLIVSAQLSSELNQSL